MKTLIIALAGTFVVGIGFTGVVGLNSCTPNAPLLPGGTASTTASTDTTAQVQAINARLTPPIQAREASITADPKNYELLVAQANAYYDWASQVLTVTKQQTDADVSLWKAAVPYYRRALMVKTSDANVSTDYSIALFYSGDVQQAISVAEQVRKGNPTFAPVVFNLGVFYANSGISADVPKAQEAFQSYLKLDPNGQNAATAKDLLNQLASSASTTATGSTTTTGQ